MSDDYILYAGIVVFVLLLSGVLMTVIEFSKKSK